MGVLCTASHPSWVKLHIGPSHTVAYESVLHSSTRFASLRQIIWCLGQLHKYSESQPCDQGLRKGDSAHSQVLIVKWSRKVVLNCPILSSVLSLPSLCGTMIFIFLSGLLLVCLRSTGHEFVAGTEERLRASASEQVRTHAMSSCSKSLLALQQPLPNLSPRFSSLGKRLLLK